ncbi:SpaA isopeptide-forming pilin-related protein [Gemmiger formicilis]|uniref:SpaA isopeptide-forming pilin-related protein n=1 Tax=Gemmiger formicilis TaxID=745368 RepID=UPI00399C019F
MGLKKSFLVLSVSCVLLALLLLVLVFVVCNVISSTFPTGGIQISPDGTIVKLEEPTASQQTIFILSVLGIIQVVSCIALPMGGLALSGVLYYHIKLKQPIAVLQNGITRIQNHDLDFIMPVRSGDELGQLCAAFDTMREELLKSNQELWRQMEERKRLNAAFSHDLRNPITVLKGTVKLLRQGTADKQTIDRLESYTQRIEQYVEAMSSIQRLEQMPLRVSECYLVVETTVPHDLFQAEPFIVTVDPEQDNNPWGAMATPKDSVMTGSDSYQKFTVLDEEIEVYLRITKVDEETGKPILLPDTAFQIYWLDEQGHYRYDSNGNPKLVTMTDTVNGHLTKDVDTFYTNNEGILTLPEKLPLGKYRIVEVTGPNGFYNEWLDSAGYENGVLADDADGSYYVDFEITTDRIYAATGDKNENGMDTLVIGENYSNHETLGKLTIRKTGEVLAGWKTEVGALDPWMTGEAEDGNFVYETRPLAGAEYTITAAEDIYTQDRQTDNYGNRTLWYAKGDVVAVVTTGDGSADIAAFAPARTKATYDFLSVIHDGTIGEVSVTLPLGSYHIEETKPPYGYIGTPESYDVTFAWDNERNDVVMATSIAKVDGAASSQSFEVVRSKDANADFTEQQTLKFYNDREKAKVGVYKVDRETGKYLAGAVFNLYAADDIYSVDGKLLFAAGELVATSPETGADGHTYFDCDIPIRGEYYGSSIRKDATTNSGNYIVKELRAPLGYYVNEEPMEVTFAYDGQAIMVLDNTCANKPTEMWVSKRDLTNDEELPGATLAIKDTDGNTVTTWVSTDEPHRVTGLHFGESYTLTEIRAADGYALANDITFRLIQKSDEDGNHLEECEVYYLTTKNILFWKWDDWKLLDDATVIMQDDITKVQISKKDLTTNEELPGAELVIKDKDGTEIDRWISTNGPHYVEKMPAGDYTLTEITAPNGYKVAESIDFTVLPTGEMQTVVMKDAREDTPTPTPDNTPTPDHTPQPTPNTTPAPTPVPAAPTATPTPLLTIPKTGDNSSLGLQLAIAGISLAGLAVLVHKSARRKDIAPRDDDDEDTED